MNSTIRLKDIFLILLLCITISFSQSCGTQSFGQRADSLFLMTNHSEIIYDIKKPDEKHFLPYVLSEISGLTYMPDDKLLAVDDETGKIFEYDLRSRKIVHSIEFAAPGDYEGVEIIGNKIYVLESDGDLHIFDYIKEKVGSSDKKENDLSRKNDTEGLGYDPISKKLLIVCKEDGRIKGNDVKGRAVYAYHIEEKKLSKNPVFSIHSKHLQKFWEKHKGIEYDEGRIKFKPSAIAFHPIEEKYYILASVGKLLLVVDRSGELVASYPIPPRVLSQPEGLCFAPNGDMYISSEGEGDRGYVLKYSMKRK